MLVALLEDTVSFSVDMRILNVPFTSTFTTMTPSSPLSIFCRLDLQIMVLATAVQLNSATPLMETLTARGGMVISAKKGNSISFLAPIEVGWMEKDL